MEVATLRSQAVDARFENASLREERALLAGRVDRLERFIQNVRSLMLEQIAPPRVFAEFSPGVLHAVVQSARAGGVDDGGSQTVASEKDAARFAVDKLPSPAGKLLTALAAEPKRRCDVDALAAHMGLEPKGGHFKRGLATLLKLGLVARDNKWLRVIGTFRETSQNRSSMAVAE